MARVVDALQCVDEWLARDPDNVQALFLRSNIFRQSGSWTKVAPDLRRVVELDPERSQARWWLAVALSNVGRYDEAVRHLELLRQHPPKDVDPTDILVRLAICRDRMGRPREVRELLDEVLAQRPEQGLALLTRGQIAKTNGQLPQAEEWLRKAARALPYDYTTHWALTECLRQQGKTKEAEKEETYANRLQDRWNRLKDITSQQMQQRPNDPDLFCEAGKLMLELGNPEGGKNWLFSALILDQQYVPALTALADYYAKQGDTAQAEDYRRQAQEERVPTSESAKRATR